MKSVLISISPQWVEKIANGEKTIEVRKTAPQEVPFKAYIYCTIGNGVKGDYLVPSGIQCGKVIGEFICDRIEMVNAKCSDYGIDLFYHDCLTNGCLTEREIEKYFNVPEDRDLRAMKGNGYVWNISDLKIYDKPKELSEFRKPCPYGDLPCWICPSCDKDENDNLIQCFNTVSRPPQSWQYIEDLGEKE